MRSTKVDIMLRVLLLPLTEIGLNGKINYLDSQRDFEQIERLIGQKERIYNLDEIRQFTVKFHGKKHFEELGCRTSSSGYSYNLYWFKLLRKISKSFISHRNGQFCFKYWDGEQDDFLSPYQGVNKILLWHSLSRLIPTDILVCSYLIGTGKREAWHLHRFYHQITMADTQLEGILSKGLSETHVHFGAARNFQQQWEAMCNPSVDVDTHNRINQYIEKSGLANPVGFNVSGIYTASFIRALMTSYLIYVYDVKSHHQHEIASKCNFKAYIEQLQLKDFSISETFDRGETFFDLVYYLLEEEKPVLIDGENKHAYFDAFEDLRRDDDKTEDYVIRCLKPYIDAPRTKTSGENIFIFEAFKYAFESTEESDYQGLSLTCKDELFAQVLLLYLRLKHEVYQINVQMNQIKGLDYFKIHYDNATAPILKKGPQYIANFENMIQNPYLTKLEIRMGIPSEKSLGKTKNAIRKQLKKVIESYLEVIQQTCVHETGLTESTDGEYCDYEESSVPRIGVVFHFIKEQDTEYDKKCWLTRLKDSEKGWTHYDKQQSSYTTQLMALKELLMECPKLSKLVVGIDAASVENRAEPWVFAPVFKIARDGKDAMRSLNGDVFYGLGLTYHVGEEYRHLLSGLRHIDEVIEHFQYRAGDRIGHGIALGVCPKRWTVMNPVLVLPRIEYLENLLWVWGMCRNRVLSVNIDEGYLERKILECAAEIYGQADSRNTDIKYFETPVSVFDLWQAYRLKFNKFEPNSVFAKNNVHQCPEINENVCQDQAKSNGFCCEISGSFGSHWNAERLLHSYHCAYYLNRMYEPIMVAINEMDIEIMNGAQQILVKHINERGVVVETNPTSNRIIGDVEDVFHHFIHRMEGHESGKPLPQQEIMFTINTDDPAVFQTDLASEFSYIFYALVEKGYPKAHVLKWIDQVRELGMSSSFVKFKSQSQMVTDLKSILKYLEDK